MYEQDVADFVAEQSQGGRHVAKPTQSPAQGGHRRIRRTRNARRLRARHPGGQWRTAPLGLAIFKGQYTSDHTLLAAAGVIIAAPIIIVFLMLQRYFISGMLEGASKE